MNRAKQGQLPYKGIYRNPRSKRNPWVAEIKKNGKRTHIGVFPSMVDAARAYDEMARKLFGEFALCNLGPIGTSDSWPDSEDA